MFAFAEAIIFYSKIDVSAINSDLLILFVPT